LPIRHSTRLVASCPWCISMEFLQSLQFAGFPRKTVSVVSDLRQFLETGVPKVIRISSLLTCLPPARPEPESPDPNAELNKSLVISALNNFEECARGRLRIAPAYHARKAPERFRQSDELPSGVRKPAQNRSRRTSVKIGVPDFHSWR